jgi:hypothetical protein
MLSSKRVQLLVGISGSTKKCQYFIQQVMGVTDLHNAMTVNKKV